MRNMRESLGKWIGFIMSFRIYVRLLRLVRRECIEDE